MAIDWKATGYLGALALAVAAGLRKLVAPFAIEQVRHAMAPDFQGLSDKLDIVMGELKVTHDDLHDLNARVSHIEGKLGI